MLGFDPLATLTQFFENIANTFGSWYTDAVKGMITFLLTSSLPSNEDIQTDFFKLNFGGAVGLALYLVTAMAVFVLLVFLLTPRRDHSMKVSRFLGSVVGLLVYAFLFFRLYTYVDSTKVGFMQFALNFITSTTDGTADDINNLLAVSSPAGVGSVVLTGIFSTVFALFATAMAFTIKMLVLVILIIYPVLIVLRPLGFLAITAFNAANSFLVVAVLTPVVMVWAIALPLVIRNIIPGAGAAALVPIVTLVCSLGALLTPLVLLIVFFRLSSKIFGHIDVQGNVAITSLPALSYDEAMRDIQDNRSTPVKDAIVGAAGMAVGAMFDEGGVKSLVDSIPDAVVTAAGVAASAQFGPMAGVVINGVYGKVKSSREVSREAREEATSPGPDTQKGDSNE
jgi:hypothetical protein